jgi:large subunit ribosomal protein L24
VEKPATARERKQTMKIRRGDEVQVIAGKDRSTRRRPRRGRVVSVDPARRRITVEGINMVKKAVRESAKIRQAGIIDMPAPIHVSNVMLVCPNCDAPTRVAYRIRSDGKKVRQCKKCKQDIDE